MRAEGEALRDQKKQRRGRGRERERERGSLHKGRTSPGIKLAIENSLFPRGTVLELGTPKPYLVWILGT